MRWELRLAISTRLRADKGLKMNRPRILLTAMLMLALCACQRSPAPSATAAPAAAPKSAPAVTLSDAARAAAKVVTADVLSAPIRELSDDRYGGRGPASAGDNKARAWLADQLKALEKAGNGTGFDKPVKAPPPVETRPEEAPAEAKAGPAKAAAA